MKPITLTYRPESTDTATVTLPGSKSMAARALIIASCACGTDAFSKMENMPDCDDTRELIYALRRLSEEGIDIPRRINGTSTSPASLRVDTGLGGTSLRFFISLAASLAGVETEIDCSPAMRRRPLAPLVDALRDAGAGVEYVSKAGYPPLLCRGGSIQGGEISIDAGVSSQFISSIMMMAPYWKEGITLRFKDSASMVSRPYVTMTAEMMRRYGAQVSATSDRITVPPGAYGSIPSRIECDWSAAGYFYEFALLAGREVRLTGLPMPGESVQGDSRIAEIYGFLGVTTEETDGGILLRTDIKISEAIRVSGAIIELDMTDIPDQVPALAVALALSGIRFRFSGVSHLRHKESDRLLTVTMEMEKIGFRLEYTENTLSWTGRRLPVGEDETIDTHGDHRIAMAMAIAAVKRPYLPMREPEVVSKSFPDFFEQIKALGYRTD